MIPMVLLARNAASEGDIQHILSMMGHRIHVLLFTILNLITSMWILSQLRLLFRMNWRTNQIRSVACCQFIHCRTVSIFVRPIVDDNDLVILSVILNKWWIRDVSFVDTGTSLLAKTTFLAISIVRPMPINPCSSLIRWQSGYIDHAGIRYVPILRVWHCCLWITSWASLPSWYQLDSHVYPRFTVAVLGFLHK